MKNEFPAMEQKRYGPDICDMDNSCLQHHCGPLQTWKTALGTVFLPLQPFC